ncbi:MAG: hypothetical protein II880_02035 [Schwartzia sp.]|nr:hypothetical protein [Schwartzia sp. (in: firmicutes)]
MSLLTLWGGCGSRLRRRRNNQRGFFLLEALVLSFLVLGCGALTVAYRALAESRAVAGAEITAAYLAQEQNAWIEGQSASYLRAHGTIFWRGQEKAALERNGTRFEISSSVSQHPETNALASIETRVRWQIGGRAREGTYRKFVAYHE